MWSVLDETTLSFFQENKRSSCIGSVELTDIQSVKIITEYQFELVTDINSQIYTVLSQEKCKEWVQKLSQYSKGQTEVKHRIPKPIPIVDSRKQAGEHTVEVKSAKNIFESTSAKEFTTASSRPVSSVLSTGQHGGEHTVEVRSAKNLFESQSTKKEITTSNTLVYSSTCTEKNKSAHTVEVKSSSHIAQASSDIKKFHTNPVIDVSISKGEVKLARNIFETLSTHKKPTPPPRPVSSTIPRISPESKRITSDPASSRPWSTIEDVRSRLHHVNTFNRVYNHPGSETSFSEQENLKRSEELKLEDARINLKPVSILKEDNKENNEATQGKEEETSEISSNKINNTIGISGDFNIVENSTQSANDLKEIEEIGVLEMDNSKKVKMSEREKNGDRVCNTRPDSGYCTTVGESGRNSKENESDETNRSSSVNVSEIINQKTNTADIISRIPDPDEQSGGKMELDQEPKEAALLVHKSNGTGNGSCSDVVTLNKQSDETNRSSSENVLENVNQRTNTAEITSQTTESDEQNGDTVEQGEEQRVSIVQLRKSKRSVSVTHNDIITALVAGNQADTQENYPPLAFPNTRRSQTSSSSSESENKDRTTISSQNIIDKSKLEENEIKAASTELDQKEAHNLSTSHHELVENYLDIDFLISKANFPNIPALPNTTPSRADLISFHELKDTLDKLGSEDECSEVPSEDNEWSEVLSTSSDQIIQRLSRLVES